jgi:NADH dehydrogenase
MRGRVLIVGGSFAGLATARGLPRDLEVTVLDPGAALEFLPNIHELVSGHKREDQLRLARAPLVRALGHRFVAEAAVELDPERLRVRTSAGRVLEADALVVAVGGVNATRGIEGADRHALPFKSVADCAAIRDRLAALAQLEPGARRVAIVGGGLEGLEALGEILRRFRRLPGLELTLIEGGARLLPEASPVLDPDLRARCRELPVTIRTRARVARVEPDAVVLASGERIGSRTTIWTGGAAPHPLLQASGLADAGAWAPVRATLQSARHDRVLVIGDAAALPLPLAKQAYHALDMGALAARNLGRLLGGRTLLPFRPAEKPMVLSFGGLDTYLVLERRVLASPALAVLKEGIYQLVMAGISPTTSEGLLGTLRRLPGAWSAVGLGGLAGLGVRLVGPPS